jgi:GNAT superfamily N-acetyltransferase
LMYTVVGFLSVNQLLKLAGQEKRNGSMLDNVVARVPPMMDWPAGMVAALVVVLVARGLTKRYFGLQAEGPSPPADGVLMTLPPSRLREAAALSAEAFASRPSNVWVAACGKEASHEQRLQFLRWLFERNFRLRVGTSANRGVFQDGRVACCFMFVTPTVAEVGLVDMILAGMLKIPFLFGVGYLQGLLQAKRQYEADTRSLKKELYGENWQSVQLCSLERVVVTPALQGRGIGSRAMREVLGEADAAGWPCLIGTNEERNVQFYTRLGFKVVRQGEYQAGGCTVQSWYMLRQPKGKRS